MKKYWLISLKLTLVFIILCSVAYPLLIAAAGKLTRGKGKGETLLFKGNVVGYANIGQRFTADRYFWSRPSAVAYNAAGSGGSNKGPSNPEYLRDVHSHVDSFMRRNPGIKMEDIPSELVTYSGSGLDPDLSPAGALVQVKRVAAARRLSENAVTELVVNNTERPLFGWLGPEKVNVLKLNIALDEGNYHGR